MNTSETPSQEDLLRGYAAGTITWRALQAHGFDDYVKVLAGLGSLGLHPPIAAMEGPNLEARTRGRALIRRLLKEQSPR